MVSCAIRSCPNRSTINNKTSTGTTFHRFPRDPAYKMQWVKFVNRGANWEPSPHSVLCSRHFSDSNLDRTSLSCVRLREHAVPTLHGNQYIDGIEFIALPSEEQKLSSRDSNENTEFTPTHTASSNAKPEQATESCVEEGISSPPSISPLEWKLIKKLGKTVHESVCQQKKLNTFRRKLLRYKKQIADMKKVITELQKKKCSTCSSNILTTSSI